MIQGGTGLSREKQGTGEVIHSFFPPLARRGGGMARATFHVERGAAGYVSRETHTPVDTSILSTHEAAWFVWFASDGPCCFT